MGRSERETRSGAQADALAQVRRDLRDRLLQRVDARGLATAPRTERRVRVREEALAILRTQGHILPQRDLARVVNEISDEVVGFGPIEFLLKDPEVTEVMVNGPDDVYVERKGRIERAGDGLF
nr:hypothetical protein [Actinomycetota bacterium]